MTYCTEHRWRTLWKRIGARGEALRDHDDLVAYYTDPHRAYHTLDHIEQCLAEFYEMRHLAFNPNALELAIWYHDAVYNPRAADEDNVEQSATLVGELAKRCSLPEEFRQQVATLIRVTTHRELPVEPDAQLMADIDLAILGQSEQVFDTYEYHIRLEYEHVPDNEFTAKRMEVLSAFYRRPVIYSTPFFYEKYEVAALQNLARSLEKLRRCL